MLTLQILNVCTTTPKRQVNFFSQQRHCLKQQNLPYVHSVKNGIATDLSVYVTPDHSIKPKALPYGPVCNTVFMSGLLLVSCLCYYFDMLTAETAASWKAVGHGLTATQGW